MRAFIALEIPPKTKEAIAKIQDNLKSSVYKVNWTKPANLHLTLKFLGEISGEQADGIKEILHKLAGKIQRFKIKLDTLSFFPEISKAKIIWIGSEKIPAEVTGIFDSLEKEISILGFPKENRPFSMHATIGRIKRRIPTPPLRKLATESKTLLQNNNLEFESEGITLFKSQITSESPVYTALAKGKFINI